MASVYQVYTTLKNLANKDEQGFVTPQAFNTFAPVAQQNIVNGLFAKFDTINAAAKRNSFQPDDVSLEKRIREDLSSFHKSAKLSRVSGAFALPSDFMRLISIRTNGAYLFNQTTSEPIDVLHEIHKLDDILANDMLRPTDSKPLAVIDNGITVYPGVVSNIVIYYYKKPQGKLATTGAKSPANPRFGYTLVNTKEVYSAANSVDFELPDQYVPDLITEIAKMIGVSISSADVYNYALQEETK